VRDGWRSLFSPPPEAPEAGPPIPQGRGDEHLELARESLRELLQDHRVPPAVRAELAADYAQVEALLKRLEEGQIHIAVFGRVSVGKSALLNALLGETHFSTGPLHGETVSASGVPWSSFQSGNVVLFDTPGIDEVGGELRERLAREVAGRSDLVLFVVDGDITATELQALRQLAAQQRPLILVLNKADRYGEAERSALVDGLRAKTRGLVAADHVVSAAALPSPRLVVQLAADGSERESERQLPSDVESLREMLWRILDDEGKSLAAVNAGIFAGELGDQVAHRVLAVRREVADKVVRSYSLGKGLGVALNPIPAADLLALAADGAMVVHLGRVYGMNITRAEAGALLRTIATQLTLLMGTVWGVSLVSSALKGVTFGLSTLVTAAAQGAVAYYGTYVIGRAAESYFAHGQTWGPGGPKKTVREILDSIDGDSVLARAREDILARLKRGRQPTAAG
jgi:small GTP-binding protein